MREQAATFYQPLLTASVIQNLFHRILPKPSSTILQALSTTLHYHTVGTTYDNTEVKKFLEIVLPIMTLNIASCTGAVPDAQPNGGGREGGEGNKTSTWTTIAKLDISNIPHAHPHSHSETAL